MARELSDMEKLFVDEYLVDLDAKNAAIRAGYKPTTANTASEWIKMPNPKKKRVREAIDKALAERSRRTGVTADRVIRELAKIAFVDIGDVVDPDTAEILPDVQKADTAAIVSIKVKKLYNGTEREIRMADRTRALELLGKHLGLFADNINIHAATPVIADDIKGEQLNG